MQLHFKAESSNRNANTSFANAAEPSRPPVDKILLRAEPIRAPPKALETPVEVFHERVEPFNQQFEFFLQPESVKLSARNSHACETPPVFRASENTGNGPRQRRSFRVGCMRPSKRAGDEENVTEEICTVRPSAGDTVLLRHNGNGLGKVRMQKCEFRSSDHSSFDILPIALPSIASTRFSKCDTRSAATSAMRFGSPTNAAESGNAEVRSPKFSQFDIPNSSFDIFHSAALSATARWMS